MQRSVTWPCSVAALGVAALGVAAMAGAAWAVADGSTAPGAAPAAASAPPPAATAPSAPGPLSFALTSGFQHTFSSDLRSAPGKTRVSRADAEANIGYALPGDGPEAPSKWRLGLRARTEFSWYNFSGATGLAAAGNPGRAMNETDFLLTATHTLDSDWSYTVGGGVRSTRQSGADLGDSITGGGLLTVRYRFSPTLAIGGGALVTSRLEDSAQVIPLLSLEWNISDTLTLASRGPGLVLTAKINDQWRAGIATGYETREFRLDDSAAVRSGVLRDHRVPVTASITWLPCRGFSLSLSAGVVVWQEYLLDNSNGVRVGSSKSKPAAVVGIQGRFMF